ncbi:MAG: hypothetical protein GWN30_37420, partial [Gammaproteobacteria bacterium]|nr:hypothetical protein [Gammaproteobacteria bacterium]
MLLKKSSIKTIRPLIAIFFLLILSGPSGTTPLAAEDEIFAYTSFEEPSTGSQYIDSGDSSTDHPLVNNPGQMTVNFTSTGGEIGFSAFYFNSRDDVGLTDGDYFGVTDYTGQVGSYTSGSQGYEMTDADGAIRLS